MIDTIMSVLALFGLILFAVLVIGILADSKRQAVRRTLEMHYNHVDVDLLSDEEINDLFDAFELLDENDVRVGNYLEGDYYD